MIDCKTGTASQTESPRPVHIYDSKGNIIGMIQVPVTSLLAPVVPDIPRGKAAHQAICKNLGSSILKEPEDRYLESGSKYESNHEA